MTDQLPFHVPERLWVDRDPQDEPDRSPKRFAPYPVWSWARIVGLLGYCCFPLAILSIAVGWLVPGFVLLALCLIIVLPRPYDSYTALLPELVGGMLGSRYCPACGQSIFDRAPPNGYMADHERGSWWPHRRCANCGHDLKVRTID
ncbi:hypothetical protein [Parerythrobacter lacustris]|uniref:Uncharacterized protein n=1 Tax=Parerythrobacter lacustris TaxID=2969984 RepID=A0ABT1XM04_9SPHN|nr:hypothetical protein [Parerythrobacter lacustris]MCR2832686.1 hypothetical protein [Parerythrobacter lacustris]